ncbi:hypothetical protein Cflav_PD1202 [Pedosphaera parvula Ellin514]|uniref:Uncharacterized protein n=1 Tax=Pedosphaera parvula (strain Ellin514) TaxID=320771 RepID=B9XQ61_PEDPL|nr:hypothetical protein Cflav_PD1202 [Pedosphaera parvula Ellin514]
MKYGHINLWIFGRSGDVSMVGDVRVLGSHRKVSEGIGRLGKFRMSNESWELQLTRCVRMVYQRVKNCIRADNEEVHFCFQKQGGRVAYWSCLGMGPSRWAG